MSETLKNNIKIVDIYPLATITGDDTGDSVDTHADVGFEQALGLVSIGAISGTPTSLKVSFIESDASDLGTTPTEVEGGAETTVVADTAYQFQLKRTKRYIGLKINFTGGTDPSAYVHASAILNNWAKPFPLV